MIRTDDIRSLTDFRQNAKEHLDRLAETRGIEVLTVNGQARGVVMAPQTFDELAELAMQAQVTAKIKRGRAEILAGQGIDARKAMKRIARKYGLTIPK